jgi:hypothetical protein
MSAATTATARETNARRFANLVDALAIYLTEDMANKTSMLAIGHPEAINWARIYQTLNVRRNATHTEAVIDVTNALKAIVA